MGNFIINNASRHRRCLCSPQSNRKSAAINASKKLTGIEQHCVLNNGYPDEHSVCKAKQISFVLLLIQKIKAYAALHQGYKNYVRKALTQKTFVALVIAEVLFPDQFRRENVVEKSWR